MAVVLGKRKRVAEGAGERVERGGVDGVEMAGEEDSAEESERDVRDVFRRHFEARFKPLPREEWAVAEEEEAESGGEDDEGEEWEGFESDDEVAVPVVEHNGRVDDTSSLLDKGELRAFMSSKPPSASTRKSTPAVTNVAQSPDEEDSAENLKNDLALKRLLAESHLLDHSNNDLDPSGKNRHKALDLRFQALGAGDSILKQEKMPMSHRKGIVKKARGREEQRRKEAKEAGIVLEKEKREKKFQGKRERGVGGPAVGRFRGGMLVLSGKDIESIEGPKKRVEGKKGRRR